MYGRTTISTTRQRPQPPPARTSSSNNCQTTATTYPPLTPAVHRLPFAHDSHRPLLHAIDNTPGDSRKVIDEAFVNPNQALDRFQIFADKLRTKVCVLNAQKGRLPLLTSIIRIYLSSIFYPAENMFYFVTEGRSFEGPNFRFLDVISAAVITFFDAENNEVVLKKEYTCHQTHGDGFAFKLPYKKDVLARVTLKFNTAVFVVAPPLGPLLGLEMTTVQGLLDALHLYIRTNKLGVREGMLTLDIHLKSIFNREEIPITTLHTEMYAYLIDASLVTHTHLMKANDQLQVSILQLRLPVINPLKYEEERIREKLAECDDFQQRVIDDGWQSLKEHAYNRTVFHTVALDPKDALSKFNTRMNQLAERATENDDTEIENRTVCGEPNPIKDCTDEEVRTGVQGLISKRIVEHKFNVV